MKQDVSHHSAVIVAPKRKARNRKFPRNGLPLIQVMLFFLMAVPPAHPANLSGKTGKKKTERGAEFFADRAIRVFQIELPPAAIFALERNPRVYVEGAVREGAQVFTNVAIHLKGMGSFRPVEDRASFVLNFDKLAPERDYCGITKLMLDNSVQDGSYVAELLATSLFRDAGVPAARVTHARVMLNGRDLGLYTAIEAMNKRFLKRWFKDNNGNLYEGYLRDINSRLDQDNGTNTFQSDLRALQLACQVPDLKERFQQLNKLLDVERFASFAALEMLIAHWDGYTMKSNNFRIYHDPASGKMVFIPHGLDATFKRLNVPVRPPMRSIVSGALFQTSEGRQMYEDRLRVLYTNVFRFEVITNRIADTLSKLRAGGLPTNTLATIERQCAVMQTRIAQRIGRVRDFLAGLPPPTLAFDAAGVAIPEGWRDERDRGEPTLDRMEADGRATLHIKAGAGLNRASWRSGFFLKPGFYRFEGQVRTAGMPPTGYADLRISGDTRSLRVSGSTAWQPLQHNFLVDEEGGTDVELVCELNSPAGEVWFDVKSLKVRRMANGQ